MADFSEVRFNPQKFYQSPDHVLQDDNLSNEQKIDVLKQWSYDEREKSVAEEENMRPLDKERISKLEEIQKALISLGYYDDSAPTKQGG